MNTRVLLLAVAVAGMAVTGCASRSVGEAFTDASSDMNVRTRLLKDRQHDYSDVDVTVFGHRLMLTGSMHSPEGRRHLDELARRTPDITEVIDEIRIGDPTASGQGAKDSLIDERLSALLLTDGGVTRRNYEIAVSNGVVYILGEARSPEEAGRVTEHARKISGVREVVSHIRVLVPAGR